MLREIPFERIVNLAISESGLASKDVQSRRTRFGDNNLLLQKKSGWIVLVFDTLRDPMLWFLLVTAGIFAITSEYREAIILCIAVVPLAGMDIFLHQRTQSSVEGLSQRLATSARVLRDDYWQVIDSVEVVAGDLVEVDANEYIPADGVIVANEQAQIDESALSGEALPVRKTEVKKDEFENGDLKETSWVYAGTRLLTGKLKLRVVFTGKETLYGEIVRAALQGRHEKTPLQLSIQNLVVILLIIALILCVLVAWVRWTQGFGMLDALISAMTLAVAALPEEFPVVFTFFLGVGVYQLAQRKTLVRRAVAVENIGRVTTICSDKTGTLTLGSLTLMHVYPAQGFDVDDVLEIAANASRTISHDPMDQAIFKAFKKTTGIAHKISVFPFTEDRKRETSVIWMDAQYLMVATKGAPEVILGQCDLDSEQKKHILSEADVLAQEGHKVIACAQRIINAKDLGEKEPEDNFRFAGILAFEDPLREGVVDAVKKCRKAGIHIIMVTGDHPLTARAIAGEMGLGNLQPRVYLANEIEHRDDLGEFLKNVDVIARCIPSQKLHFVQQLQAAGEIVAVTGDGVNDVPALQVADIGIAMGEHGTQAAREVAAVVLMDDNFRTIVRAISEGMQLFKNLRMSFAYLLMIHIPLLISAAVIPLTGFPLLYLPVHIVWLELIIHPTALLVFQNLSEDDLVTNSNSARNKQFFSKKEWALIALVGLLLTVILVGGYQYSLGSGYNVEHARSMAMAILCVGSAVIAAMLSGMKTRIAQNVVVLTLVSAIVILQSPVATSLHLQALHMSDWGLVLTGSVLIGMITRRLVGKPRN